MSLLSFRQQIEQTLKREMAIGIKNTAKIAQLQKEVEDTNAIVEYKQIAIGTLSNQIEELEKQLSEKDEKIRSEEDHSLELTKDIQMKNVQIDDLKKGYESQKSLADSQSRLIKDLESRVSSSYQQMEKVKLSKSGTVPVEKFSRSTQTKIKTKDRVC